MGRIVKLSSVERFDGAVDVIVCGLGGAGVCAALEASAAGSSVLVLERFSAGGGSTQMSACEMYLGGNGGTTLQRELGFEDSSENFRNYLEACFGDHADPAKVDAFVDGAAEHFDWMEAQGVPYKRAYFDGRDVVALTGDSLQYTGNERAWPFTERSAAVPRGHLPADAGHSGGRVLMGVLLENARTCTGITIRCDARVRSLIVDDAGAVCGVAAKIDNRLHYFFAHQGVVLSAGGFIMNEQMTRQHIAGLDGCAMRHGNPGDTGDGILLGTAAGGHAINMGEAFVCVAHYPPPQLTFGIFVNEQGQRFLNEDTYLARMGDAVTRQTNQRAFMFIDNRNFARPAYQEHAQIVAVGETVEEVERESGLPGGALQQTVAFYNAHAAKGQDPLFHKHADWLLPFDEPPFALVDYSLATLRPAVFTLGGLDTLPSGEVLTPDRDIVAGLYAAGRTAAGIPRTSAGYASGMSVADATFTGRRAGRAAAGRDRRPSPGGV
jgi:succinate dehydrogenase/fumarate reductase flavoprotein subunit